eukprot:gnl/TRDRNA2_/TRDRNA2_88000_c0_seq1.p1 gnl/TRDRNA2_/TRDRNA2_88000_c0~~gnl/TRDRNA2_/TRDRNA2_88000_c0_seq1.p1  ORF type:complete len:392 (-),score=73.63 gnl/TRDRNA2_/TRDRNA2_88000_c0_seq1:12-1187(-)
MEPRWCCMQCQCISPDDDPDAFDGRAFLRSSSWQGEASARLVGHSASRTGLLSCQPCNGDDRGDTNPDPQKHRFESKARWGDKKADQFTRPQGGGPRNVVARGMKRFEIGKVAPAQPPWEKISPSVICVLAFNPSGFTLNGTCCYLVGTGKRRILIDTGESDIGHEKFMETLDECMLANDIEGIQEILLTHMHHDHYGGVMGLVKRYGMDTPISKLPNPSHYWSTIEVVKERGLVSYLEFEDGTPRYQRSPSSNSAEVPPECMVPWPDEEAEAGLPLSWDIAQRTKVEFVRDYGFVKRSWEFGYKLENELNFKGLQHGDLICTEGATLVAYHTPGHSTDHCSYWFQEEKSLFSGDHVLGWGTTFIFDLYDYMKTLAFMIALQPVHLYPGRA